MSRPFDPPGRPPEPRIASSRTAMRRWVAVVGAWGLATTAVGTAVGGTLQLFGTPHAAARLGILGLFAGFGVGAVALLLERSYAARRPDVVTGPGISDRPLHGALLGLPIALAVPALLWLVVVASVAVESPLVGVLFGIGALGLTFAGFRVLAHHRLARGIEALQGRRNPGSTESLELLARSPLSPRRVRTTAQLAVALSRLQEGRGLEALGWLDGIDDGSAEIGEAGAWAAAGRAMAGLLLQHDPGDAEAHLVTAFDSPYANVVRAQADAVRVLVVWRREGPAAARRLAESLLSADATPLHLALLARLREREGDRDAARALGGDAVDALLESGLGRAIPELRPDPGSASR